MAHCITNIDEQEGIEQAWHGLTKVKPMLQLDECFLSRWDIVPEPLFTADMENTPFRVLRCNETKQLIGPAFNSSYYPITNKRFLEVVKESLAGTDHKIASVGSVCGRSRIFVSVKLGTMPSRQVGKRRFESYLNFGSSHDQSCKYYVNTSNTCTVCHNTFQMNLNHRGGTIQAFVKHTKQADQRLDNIVQIIDAAIGVQAEFAAAMQMFETRPVNKRQARVTLTGFVAPREAKKPEDLSSRTVNQVNRMVELFEDGKGNQGRDASDLFSAVTDYYTHESSGGEDKLRQFTSSEFGTGADRKTEFFSLLQDKDRLAKVYERGQTLVGTN